MTPPTARVLSLFLRLLRNNRIVRLLRQAPSNLFYFIRIVFHRIFTKRQHQDGHKSASNQEGLDFPDVPTICASHVPTSLSIPQQPAGGFILNVTGPHDNGDEGVPMESLNTPRLRTHRLSLQSTQLQNRRSFYSSNSGLLSALTPDPSASHLSLPNARNSVQSVAPSIVEFDNEQVTVLPSTMHGRIDCMLSTELSRYLRKHTIPQADPTVIIRALEREYSCQSESRGLDEICSSRRLSLLKVLTDVDISNEEVLRHTQHFLTLIFDSLRAKNLQLENEVELVVETVKYDGEEDYRCGYYFVDHKNRCLFWLEDFDISHALWDAWANTSLSHIKLEIEVSYWQHWELFCNIQVATEDILDELTEILTTDLVDLQTSDTSNALFSADELQSYLRVVEISRRPVFTSRKSSPFFVGRLMSMYMRQRFANFWGEYGARLHREQSVHHPNGIPCTWLITVLSPFFFNAPDVHLRALHLIFIDEVASTQPWRTFIKKLNEEWQDFIINSAVLLAANVSFLAIQSVDNIKDEPYRSPSQIASYLSTLASISSMIIGLLLVRQTRTKGSASAQHAADYLRARRYRVVGHEPLAIMYSLPYAFLMWGMVFLMIALLLVCFLGTTLVTRIIPGLAALTCITMIVWCIWMGWDRGNDPHESLWNTFVNALSRWRSHFFETLKPWGYLCGKKEQDLENPPPTAS
ncbi:hypothetical protein EYR36_009937 [Pleurotus pulmonarius]|nr:hypothetical protein EYR36_009937 [Pleurotus pulmonarius]